MVWIIITVVSVILSGMFSGIEIAYVTGDRVRAELDSQKKGMISSALRKFYSDSQFFITTILVGNNIVLVVYGMGIAYLLEPWLVSVAGDNEALILLLQTLISTGVILLCGEFLPKTIFRINPNASLRVFALPMMLMYLLLYPISVFSTWLSRLMMRIMRMKGEETERRGLSIVDLNAYLERNIEAVDESSDAPQLEKEVKIFHNALDFSSTMLRDCMTPRNEIFAVDINDTTREDLVSLFQSSGRSKLLVYREDIDNILGYIHVSELFKPQQDWHKCIKDVIFAPETLLANKMMRRFLSEKRSLAIVIDEYGGTSGIVTLEDLVEEIFGDIRDEHDREAPIARKLDDDSYEFSGRIEIEYINEQFSLDIPEEDEYQTLAGYLLHNLGSIPQQGQVVDLGAYRFTIVKGTATRLELITVTPNPDNTDNDE